MAKYYVTFTTQTADDYKKQSQSFETYAEAIQLLYDWVEADKAETFEEDDNLEYRVHCDREVIAMYEAWNGFYPKTYTFIDGAERFIVPYGELTLDNAKPQFSHGGKRTGAGRKPNALPKKNINLRVTEEEAALVKAYLAELRKTQ